MCKAASFIVLRGHKVVFHPVHDSHSDIIKLYGLHEGMAGADVNFVPVEYSPPKGNLSLPFDRWKFNTDLPPEQTPMWYNHKMAERAVFAELPAWAEKLRGVNLKEAFNPVNPLLLTPSPLLTEHKAALRSWASVSASVWASVRDSVGDSVRDSVVDSVWDSVGDSVWDSVRASVRDSVWDSVWASVRASVRDSVWDSVWASVRDSVGDSVWDSVWASVRDSVWDSVWASVGDSVRAYTGGLFSGKIKSWKYAEKLGENPWGPLQKLWYAGYVPSFDGKTWRLHCGENAKIAYEWTPK